jgi:ribose/xylose/arabinose/galactoside ABC-type transport system permease subunit
MRALHRLRRGGGPLLGLCATWLLFALAVGPRFTDWANTELMLLQTAVVGTAAVGALWIIVSGGIDLAVGSTVALATMIGAMVMRAGGHWTTAAAATTASGAGIGFLIGALVTGHLGRVAIALGAAAALGWCGGAEPVWRLGLGAVGFAAAWLATARLPWRLPLSPFLVTLGLWGALRGLAKGIGGNQPIYFDRNDTFAGWMQPGAWLLPAGVWVMFAVAVAMAVVGHCTVYGRHVFALGQNREAARLSGVDIERTERLVYVLGGACAGIAAVLQLSFLSMMGDPTTAQGLELKAIASGVIGGASLAGGAGSFGGTLVGAFVMTVVDNGCTKCELDNWVQEVVTGAIIVGAVALDRWRQRRR